jgi:hypothetical protein
LWVKEWSDSGYDPTSEAAEAIRAIGTNGLPFLIGWITREESPLRRKLFGNKLIPDKFNPLHRDFSRMLWAGEAINLLGSNAQAAFPTLTNLATNKSHALPAGIALAGMGSNGIAVLTKLATNQDGQIRLYAAEALADARTDFEVVIPALIEAVKMGGQQRWDSVARGAAGTSLVSLHKKPELVAPALASFLTNKDPLMRSWGATLLGTMGAGAKVAFPQLRSAQKDSDPAVRQSAQDALKEIESDSSEREEDSRKVESGKDRF